jgi:hypothetical protein
MRLTTHELWAVPFPTCGVAIGEPCLEGSRRVVTHQARVRQAELLRHWRCGTRQPAAPYRRERWRRAGYERRR